MKKLFGIVIPLLIIFVIGVVLTIAFLAGKKGIGCDLSIEPGVQAGKKDHQIWIDEIEKYKLIHGGYPAKLEDLDQNILGIGKGFSHPNVSGGSSYFEPNGDRFSVTFYFKNDYICPLGQSRKCTYTSETKDWNCQ